MRPERDAELLAAIGATYGLVARIFGAELDAALHAILGSTRAPAELDLFADRGKRREAGADPETSLRDLAAEYCRLFIGPNPRCAPYGSLWQAEAGLLGRIERRVVHFAEEAGIALALASPVVAADHVAVAFEILSELHARASRSERPERDLGLAAEFLDRLVLPWMPEFLEEVRRAATMPFYRRAAELALHLVQRDSSAGAGGS